jgi:hypothetical protein
MALPALPAPALPSPSALPGATALGSIMSSAACGLNLGLEAFKGLLDGIKSLLSGLLDGVGALGDMLSSLKDTLLGKLNDLTQMLKGLFAGIELPSFDLHSGLKAAFGALMTGVGDFFGMLRGLMGQFPSVDWSALFGKFSLPSFDFCKDVPNMKIINGAEVLKAMPEIKPISAVTMLPNPPTIPTIPPMPEFKFPRMSVIALP